MFVHHRCAPTWRFHTGLCKFLRNISTNIYSLGKRTDLFPIRSQLLVFSVTPFKIDQNKKSKPFNRLSPESGNRKKVHMQLKTLAKIQITAIFLMEDMRRNVFPKFREICMETPCWCPCTWAPTWRPETSRNICH